MHPRQVSGYVFNTLKFISYQLQAFWGIILSDGGLTYRKTKKGMVASFVFGQSIRYFTFFHQTWVLFRAFLHGACDIHAGPNQRIAGTFTVRLHTRFFLWLGVFANS